MPLIAVKTFGCKVNLCDSSELASRLTALGAEVVRARGAKADAFLVNTCAVTERALKKCAKYLRALRRAHPDAPIAVFGCGPSYGKGLFAVEGASLFPRGEEREVIAFLAGRLGLDANIRNPRSRFPIPDSQSHPRSPLQDLGKTRGFLKVADGCDGRCTYCVVPKLRGSLRSKPLKNVLSGAASLAAAGHREIVLTGIHLGRFGVDLEPPVDLGGLVRRVADVEGVERVRLSSIEALEVGENLLSLAGFPAFAPHFHLPLQSGDADILRRMGRTYAPEVFLEKVAELRSRFETVAITTDVIVGFPGETKAAFGRTLKVCRSAGFSRIHAFPFSPREGTPASAFPGRPPAVEVRARMTELIEEGRKLKDAFRHSRIGEADRVLVEREATGQPGVLEGLDGTYQRVVLPGRSKDIGQLVPVRLSRVEGEFIVAERL